MNAAPITQTSLEELHRAIDSLAEQMTQGYDGNFSQSIVVKVDIQDEHIQRLVSMINDISHSAAQTFTLVNKQNAEILANEARLRQLNHAVPIGIFEMDEENNILYTNPRWQEIAQLSLIECLSSKWEDILYPDDVLVFSQWKDAVREKGSFECELRLRLTGKEQRWIRVNVVSIYSDSNENAQFIGTATDITEEKKFEEEKQHIEVQLRHAQKLESIGQLASGIAHEINTPMQFISDNTHFLNESFDVWLQSYQKQKELLLALGGELKRPELTETIVSMTQSKKIDFLSKEVPKAIQHTLEGIDRVTQIVRAMKDFSHPGKQEKSAIDLNKAIDNTVMVARNEWKYVSEVVTHFDETLPLVVCYRDEFNQVVLNLIVNSAHAISDVVGNTGEKGTITLSTCRVGEWVEIRIQDTGGGIPEKIKDRVFDPFFTTKPVGKGTGQGLAIAHTVITKKHKGTIHFESKEGVGTTFIIRLPISGSLVDEENMAAAG